MAKYRKLSFYPSTHFLEVLNSFLGFNPVSRVVPIQPNPSPSLEACLCWSLPHLSNCSGKKYGHHLEKSSTSLSPMPQTLSASSSKDTWNLITSHYVSCSYSGLSNIIFQLEKIPPWHFSMKDTQMSKKNMKRYSTSLVTREIRIKSTMRHCFAPTSVAITKHQLTRTTKYELGRMWKNWNPHPLLVGM